MTDFVEMPLLAESDDAHGGRFDRSTAAALQSAFAAAACMLEEQTASRAALARTGGQDFKGHFAEVFSASTRMAAADARNLAAALRLVADAVPKMLSAAREEDARRSRNNEWVRRHNARSGLARMIDSMTGSQEPRPNNGRPGKGPSFGRWNVRVQTRQTPTAGAGGGVVSSARPDNLRSFATGTGRLDDALSKEVGRLNRALEDFDNNCRWVRIDARPIIVAYLHYRRNSSADAQWAAALAAAFERAGGSGRPATLPDAALDAALRAAGAPQGRDPLAIASPTIRGEKPGTGYADDPVNAASGNFVELERDLGFTGPAAALSAGRTYNSMNPEAGLFGPGWSSTLDQRLRIDAESAHWQVDDGRVIVFPRDARGWGRAVGANLWLAAEPGDDPCFAALRRPADDGELLVTRDNAGSWWAFTQAGRWLGSGCGRGCTVSVRRGPDGAPARLSHERGRWIDVEYADGLVAALEACDGRRVDYSYRDGRLVEARGADGPRRYLWDDAGRVRRVISPAGVIEVENTYDERGRVATQTSAFGRTSHYIYLPGGVTVVADADGGRPNTWIHDDRARLIGAVDSHGYRQSMSWDPHGNLVMATARDGATTLHRYDERGRPTRTVTPEGADISYAWDEHDRMVTASTPDGAQVSLGYDDPVGRDPSRITDALGAVMRLTWRDGLLTRVVDPTGVGVELAHDAEGNPTAVRDAAGATTALEWDAAGRLTGVVRPSGARTRYERDPAGRLVARQDADGAVWRFEYDGAGRHTATVDPAGARTEAEYAANGQIARVTDPLGRLTEREFDDLGNLAGLRLPGGARWLFDHDCMSRPTGITDPDGGRWTRTWNRVGEATGFGDPSGVRISCGRERSSGLTTLRDAFAATRLGVDPFGRPVRLEHPDGSAETVVRDAAGNVVETVDACGGRTLIERDPAGRVTAVVSPQGAATRCRYDSCGRPWRITDPGGGVTELGYDRDQRLVSRRRPDGEVEEFAHDAVGRLVEQRIPGAGTTRYRYDLCGRMVWSRDPVHGARRFRHDAAGRLVEAIDGVGGRTRFGYDERDRLVRVDDAAGGTTRYGYTGLDGIASITDPLGRVTEAHHDSAGRLTALEGADGHLTDWSFDRAGRLTAMAVDGQTVATWREDAVARTLTVTDHTRPDGQPVTHRLSYDPAGRLVRSTRRARTGGETGQSWAWDADGRRTGFVDAAGHRTGYSYGPAGLLVEATSPGLPGVTYSYDETGLPAVIGAGRTRQAWARCGGEEVTRTLRRGSETTSTRVRRDEEGRVAAITRDGATTHYTYDAAGQLVAAVTRAHGREGERSWREEDRERSWREEDRERSWRYDACGRLVAETGPGGRVEYSYDAAGQLVEVSGPEGVSSYAYDGQGRRTRCDAADGSTTEFTWSATGRPAGISVYGPDRSPETHRLWFDALGELAEVDGAELWWDTASALPRLTGAGDRPVTWLPGGLTGVGGLWTAAAWRPVRATDPDDPWACQAGGGARLGGVLPEGVTLSGAGSLCVAGLEVLGARVYDPASRAFLSRDPLGPVPGAGWSGNPYAYAGNNPVGLTDPSGLRPITDADLAVLDGNGRAPFGGAGRWFGDNRGYLSGGPVGGPGAAAGPGALIFPAGCRVRVANGWEFTGSMVGGGRSSAVGGLAGPAAGSIAGRFGRQVSGLTARETAGSIGLGASAGSVVSDVISGRRIDARELGIATLSGTPSSAPPTRAGEGAPGGTGASRMWDVPGHPTSAVRGAFDWNGKNSSGLWPRTPVGGGDGAGAGLLQSAFGHAVPG